jgi:hypothetical protein
MLERAGDAQDRHAIVDRLGIEHKRPRDVVVETERLRRWLSATEHRRDETARAGVDCKSFTGDRDGPEGAPSVAWLHNFHATS